MTLSLMRRVSSSFPHLPRFANRSFCTMDYASSSSLAHGIHVFHCPDAVGIVAKLSECIASRGGNILGADIFVPENKNVFFSRSEFLFDSCKWPRMQMDEDFLKISKMFNALRSVVRVPDIDPKYKIAVFASKQDHCLVDLLHQWQGGRLPVEITCVISNHNRAPDTHVMRFLDRHGIAYHHLQTYNDNKREGELLELVKDTDFIVLARYMQGSNPSKQAFDAGVKLIGATSHFVTEELDAGPIIEQMVERVSHRDNLHSYLLKSENLEKQCLTKAIKSYCELRVLPYEQNRTVVF